MFTIILVGLAAIAVIGTIRNAIIRDELEDLRDLLDKREIAMDERANRLALWENELRNTNTER